MVAWHLPTRSAISPGFAPFAYISSIIRRSSSFKHSYFIASPPFLRKKISASELISSFAHNNKLHVGPQGMSGCASVMGVHIENTARHPSTIGVAVNVGCWSHRRGLVRFDRDLNATVISHKGVTL